MSYKLIIENKYGSQLQLTGNRNYKVKATGLNPVAADIVTATVANYDGEIYKSAKKQKRNIVLIIFVQEPVETNRINLYKYINSKDWIRLYFKNGARDVYIDGYVESFELDHFAQTQTAQVSIICPQSNFIDMRPQEATNGEITKGFSFPFYTTAETSKGEKLQFAGVRGTVRFRDFLAEPETGGLGTLTNGAYYLHLNFETAGRTKEVAIPLGRQMDGANLIHGGASLIDESNCLITNVLVDHEGNVLTDKNGNIFYE